MSTPKALRFEERELHTAGFCQRILVHGGPTCCGDIRDGISLRFAGKAGGVVSFASLCAFVDDIRTARTEAAKVCALEGHDAGHYGMCWRCGGDLTGEP